MTSCVLLLGAAIGSFLNVCIWRLATERSLVWPGSTCPRCLSPVRWYDNIPVLAQLLWLGGRCRDCGTTISPTYALGEAAVGVLFAVFFWAYFAGGVRDGLHGFARMADEPPGLPWPDAAALIAIHYYLLGSLWVATFIDLRHKIIPSGLTDVGIGLGLLASALYEPLHLHGPLAAGPTTVALGWGAAGGWSISWLLGRAGLWSALSPFQAPEDPPVRQPITAHLYSEEEPEEPTAEQLAELQAYAAAARWQAGLELLEFAPVVLGACLAGMLISPTAIPQAEWFVGLGTGVLGASVGAGVVWLTRIWGTLVFGREGMGLGDVYLMGMVGAFLGWQHALLAFLVAPFPGLMLAFALRVDAIADRVLGKSVGREIPFGPALALASAAVMLAFHPLAEYFVRPMATIVVGDV